MTSGTCDHSEEMEGERRFELSVETGEGRLFLGAPSERHLSVGEVSSVKPAYWLKSIFAHDPSDLDATQL